MARKDPEERRIELLKTAQDLFYKQGYDDTSIAEIIQVVGIAKGTFYHYFHSKEDLLAQLAEQQTDVALRSIEKKVSSLGGNAVDKFRGLIANILDWKIENREMMMAYVRAMYSDKNLLMRRKINQIYIEKVMPIFSKVIYQGTEEGIFNVQSPEDTSETFLYMLIAMAERIAPITLSAAEDPKRVEELVAKVLSFENALERVLGMKEGTLKIYDPQEIRRFFHLLSENNKTINP